MTSIGSKPAVGSPRHKAVTVFPETVTKPESKSSSLQGSVIFAQVRPASLVRATTSGLRDVADPRSHRLSGSVAARLSGGVAKVDAKSTKNPRGTVRRVQVAPSSPEY